MLEPLDTADGPPFSTQWAGQTTRKADVARSKDGKIIEFFEIYDTAAVLACGAPA